MTLEAGSRFVGRSTELALVERSLDTALAGSPALVLISGEPGIGKTRLADAISVRAAARGAAVAWGRCWEFGGAPAFWPWSQLLERWGQAAAWQGAIEAGAGAGDAERARFQVFRAATALVATLAAEAPRVIVVDDAHAADPSSLLLLRFLLREIGAARLLVVVTFRDVQADPTEEVRALLAALGRDARRIELGGLGEHDVGQLVADALGRAGSSGMIRTLREATGGNPFYLGEVLTNLAAKGGGEPARLEVPAGVRDAVATQLARFDDDGRAVLAAMSVIGRPAAIGLVEAVASRPAAATIDRARRERILVATDEPGHVGFAHALFRETLYQQLGQADRAVAHRRAGEALERAGGDPDARAAELARHFTASAELGDAPRALGHAIRAAELAMQRSAYEDAVVHLESARWIVERWGGGDPDARRVVLALGDAQIAAGQRPRAAESFRRAAELAERAGASGDLARAAIGAARTVEFVTLDPATIGLLERAEAALDAAGDTGELRARLLARLAVALWMDPTARDRRDALSARAIELARPIGDRRLTASVLGARLHALHGPDGIEERLVLIDEILELAREAGDREQIADGLRTRAGALLELGEVARADLDIEAQLQLAEELRLPHVAMNAVMRKGLRAMMAGRWDEAEALIARTHEIGTRAQDPTADLVRACAEARLAAELGRTDQLAATIAPLAAGADRLHWGVFIRAQLARALAVLGRLDEARAELLRVVENDFARLPRDFVHVATLCLIAETAIALGERAICARCHELLLPYAGRTVLGAAAFPMGSAWRYLGMLAAALGRTDEARADLRRAIEHARRIGAWPDLAHAEAALAQLGVTPAEPAPTGTAALLRHGETWTIEIDGRSFALKDRRGLGHLARLLAEPGRSLHALELAAPDARDGLDAGEGLPVLDAPAKAAYRARLEQLRELAEDAEARGQPERAARARTEIDAIAAELAGALGLGGRDRRTGAAAERARSAVTLAIRRAIEAIGEHAPDLARHLEVSVKTGVFCEYAPDPRARLAWRVTA